MTHDSKTLAELVARLRARAPKQVNEKPMLADLMEDAAAAIEHLQAQSSEWERKFWKACEVQEKMQADHVAAIEHLGAEVVMANANGKAWRDTATANEARAIAAEARARADGAEREIIARAIRETTYADYDGEVLGVEDAAAKAIAALKAAAA